MFRCSQQNESTSRSLGRATCNESATVLHPLPTRLVFRRPIIFSFVHSFVYFFFHLDPHCVRRAPFAPRSFTVKAVEYISCLIRALTILTRRSHRQRPFSFLFLCSLLAISQVSHAFLLLVFSSRHTTLFCLLSHAPWALPTPILCESPALHGLCGRQSFSDLLGGVWFPSPCHRCSFCIFAVPAPLSFSLVIRAWLCFVPVGRVLAIVCPIEALR